MHSTIHIHQKAFVPFLDEKEIAAANSRLAQELKADYADKRPLFIAILNGSFIFAADLFKELDFDCEICFIKLASYKGTTSTGHVVTAIGLDAPVKDRHVVVLEDIVDTGKTLSFFLPQLTHQHPASMKLCVLLHKPEATTHPLHIDYLGFPIPNRFVVGYGLDFDGLGRNLPAIYQAAEE
jgi:hypoxanthine phosphoribosyltransferase